MTNFSKYFFTFTFDLLSLRMRLEDLELTLTPGLGVKGVVHLLECFPTAEHVFQASESELREVSKLRVQAIKSILERKGRRAAEREMEYCNKHNISILASTDSDYPTLLKECNDYPHIIYVRGDKAALQQPMLSMVGTRDISHYGERVCQYLIHDLAERIPNLTIVSGLAFGVDSACHRLALEYGLKCVAVVANPLPDVTPVQHSNLAREIVESGGAIISELPSSTHQNGMLYVARNRIIAGLSEGTIVIESGASGGSLLTAGYADDYNRVVMATPGRIGDRSAIGTNALIRNRKAQMVLSAEDIIKELMWDVNLKEELQRAAPLLRVELTRDEAGLLNCFRSDDPLSMAELEELSSLDHPTLTALLLSLEISGEIRQLPGNRYEKLRR